MNEFDKENVRNILAGHGDWYGAQLLRTIALGSAMEQRLFYISYPEEMQAVVNLDLGAPQHGLGLSEAFNEALAALFVKADRDNKQKLARCFSRLEAKLESEIPTYK